MRSKRCAVQNQGITLNIIFLCFKLIIVHHHTPKDREIKLKPRIRLNQKTNGRVHKTEYLQYQCNNNAYCNATCNTPKRKTNKQTNKTTDTM